jgi:hypoxanthine-guanine phosphoribosyltransferase
LDLSVTKGRHVILVEDIVDTGLTLTMLRKKLLEVRCSGVCPVRPGRVKKEETA